MITTGQDAPSSSDSFLTPARAAMRSPIPVEPVNDTFRTRGSATSSVAERAARAGQHRQHALGQPGVDEARRQRQRGQRGVAGRLEDDRVPGRQRRRDLVQHQQRREVERGDRDDDADRLADGEADLVEARARVRVQRQGVAVELGALERREPDEVARAACLRRRLGDRLAVLGADRRGDLRGALVGERGGPQQDPHPLVGGGAPPGHRAALGRLQGELDVRPGPPWGPPPRRDPSYGERTSSVSPDRAAVHWPPISNWVLVNAVSSLVSSGRRPAPARAIGSFRTLRRHAATIHDRSWTIPRCGWTVQETARRMRFGHRGPVTRLAHGGRSHKSSQGISTG